MALDAAAEPRASATSRRRYRDWLKECCLTLPASPPRWMSSTCREAALRADHAQHLLTVEHASARHDVWRPRRPEPRGGGSRRATTRPPSHLRGHTLSKRYRHQDAARQQHERARGRLGAVRAGMFPKPVAHPAAHQGAGDGVGQPMVTTSHTARIGDRRHAVRPGRVVVLRERRQHAPGPRGVHRRKRAVEPPLVTEVGHAAPASPNSAYGSAAPPSRNTFIAGSRWWSVAKSLAARSNTVAPAMSAPAVNQRVMVELPGPVDRSMSTADRAAEPCAATGAPVIVPRRRAPAHARRRHVP